MILYLSQREFDTLPYNRYSEYMEVIIKETGLIYRLESKRTDYNTKNWKYDWQWVQKEEIDNNTLTQLLPLPTDTTKQYAWKPGTGWEEVTGGGGTDEKVKYDAGDPTAGYVVDKFIAGVGITLSEGTGANVNKLKITNNSTLRPPVIDWYDPSAGLPVAPTVGDRYISDGSGSGWTDGYIYEWDGTTWVEEEPDEGWMVWMLLELIFYVFFSGGWMEAGEFTFVKLDQTIPQTFTGGALVGTGLINVTAGQIGLDTKAYIEGSEVSANETDPVFSGSEAANFVAGDKANLDNQSGVNTGDQDLSGKADTDLSNIDISGLTEETAPNDNDILLLQADSDSSIYKVKKSNICGNSDIEYVSIFENDFILYANYSATSAYMYIVDNLTVYLAYSSVVNSALTNARDGIWKMTVTNTSNGSDASIASGLSIIAGGGIIILKGSFMIDSLFTSTQDALIIFGLTGTPGISVRYEYSANSSNFLIYHRKSGTVYAIIDTGLAVVAQTWYDVEIISNAKATLWQVYINGKQYGGDITTDIPDVTIPTYVNCRLVKKVGDSTSRIVYWDYFKYKKIFTNAR